MRAAAGEDHGAGPEVRDDRPEQSGRGERAYDIYSLLLRERISFLGTPIDDMVAQSVMGQPTPTVPAEASPLLSR